MPGFTDELVAIRLLLEEFQRHQPCEMLWEDPQRACQPFWDMSLPARDGAPAADSDDPPPPLVVMSCKPYVERRVRSRTR